MRFNSRKARIVGFGASLLVAASLAVVGSTVTGAYFSDTKQGNVTGTHGSIKITGSGGNGVNGLDLQFDKLLPGEPQTVNLNYANTGNTAQDVWVVFNNADALHALNDLGTYGEFHVASNGTPVFDSANLNDNAANSCGPLSPTGCWPVPKTIKLASNVAPGATGTASFTFGYASKLKTQSSQSDSAWNQYPLGAPTASGLPYQLVATQTGQQP